MKTQRDELSHPLACMRARQMLAPLILVSVLGSASVHADEPSGGASQPSTTVVHDAANPEKAPDDATQESLYENVAPWAAMSAGVLVIGAGIATTAIAALPFIRFTSAQQALVNAEDANADLETARELQAVSYREEKTFQAYGVPALVAGGALIAGGLGLVATGTTAKVVQLWSEE